MVMTPNWEDIEPRYRELAERDITAETVDAFLRDWTTLADDVGEMSARIKLATDQNTADEAASERFRVLVEEIGPRVEEAEHGLITKLLESGLVPEGMEVPLQRMRVDAELFREENLTLSSEESLLVEKFFQVTGAQTAEWEGEEIPISQLAPVMEEQDREVRERAWRVGAARRLEDREALDEIWRELLALRQRMAANAGFPDYLSYRWKELKRFDYMPEDAQEFHRTIERVVVPVLSRMFERRRQRLGIDSTRPWDRDVDVSGRPPLKPYEAAELLEEGIGGIVRRVDPALGEYFDTMRREGLLDLESRKNKAPGAYCISLPASGRPFIFGNATFSQDDVETLVHEAGHAFHDFEMAHLPYAPQKDMDSLPIEFAEVASMAMELLSSPYWGAAEGGFYSAEDAGRARLSHLQTVMVLLPWIAAIDAFQHWVYRHPEEAADPEAARDHWAELIDRYLPFVDWSGLEEEKRNDWHRVVHVFAFPLYYIEYAIAQLGALQVWAGSRNDQAGAVQRYRQALSLGATASLPNLYRTAGVRFAFDEATVREGVELVESTMAELEAQQP